MLWQRGFLIFNSPAFKCSPLTQRSYNMIKVRNLINWFYAGYGDVPPGVILEMTVEDAFQAIEAGRVELFYVTSGFHS